MHKRTILSFLLLIFMLGSMLIVEPALATDTNDHTTGDNENYDCSGDWNIGTSGVGDTAAPGGGCGNAWEPKNPMLPP